jgi:tetratricopeptide (TPR) repeat protein
MTDCPGLEALEEWVASAAPSPELVRHLEECAACRARSTTIREDHRLLADLIDAAATSTPASAATPAAIAPPEIDGYDVLAELHRGGQGVVFRAKQLSTGRDVALKVLLDGTLATPLQLARFEREIAAVVGLRHPNIVTVYDRGETRDGRRWFTMELVDGVTLDRFAEARRTERWSARAATEFFLKIVAAVHHAHQRGVIHRDLKPGNVLVDAAGEPRVLDFGLAKAIGDETGAAAGAVTRPGWFLGTLAYASPEQLRGEPDQVDVRSDVYSLGVLLFELVVGGLPYRVDGSLAEVVRTILESEPRIPRDLDDELAAILRRALAKDPERRYESARDLGRDLERWLRGEAVEAKRGRLGYLVRTIVRRHKLRFAAASTVLLVVVAAAIVSTTAWRRAVRDAEKRTRVDGFVQRMFSSLDPESARGRTVTVREVLAAAAAELDGEAVGEPEVEAELRQTIGRACASVGQIDDAAHHFERALALLRSVRPAIDLDVAATMTDLANACFLRGELARAEQLDRDALAWLERQPDVDPATLAVALKNLGQLRAARGDAVSAESMFRRAIDLWRRVGKGDEIVRSLTALGQLEGEQGRFDEAEAHLKEAHAISAGLGAPKLLKQAETAFELGVVASRRDPLDDARASLEEALRIDRQLLDESDPEVLVTKTELALVVSAQEGVAAAAELRRTIEAALPTLAGKELFSAARVQSGLGLLALEAGELAVAEERQRAAVALYDRLVGRVHRSSGVERANLGWVLLARGRVADAERTLRDAFAIQKELALGDEVDVATTLRFLAWTELERGDLAEAEGFARDALAIVQRKLDDGDRRTRDSRCALAWILHRKGDDAAAEKLLRDCVTSDESDESDETARADRMLAEVLRTLGRNDEAEHRYRAALEAQRKRAGAQSLDLATTLDVFGWFLVERRRLDEAGPLLEEALATRRARFGGDHPLLAWSLNNVGAWHYFRRELDLARQCFEESVAMGRRVAAASDPALGTWIGNLAALAYQDGDLAKSEPLLLEAHQIARAAGAAHQLEAKRLAATLAELYRKRGDRPRAAEFEAEAQSR